MLQINMEVYIANTVALIQNMSEKIQIQFKRLNFWSKKINKYKSSEFINLEFDYDIDFQGRINLGLG
ncbi:unnamed protein product [Paramecium primaurelia]|uniref:Uncharacterized protein n=1 Tax=Paramecium primaurelia TaxID=5886 RepID=A0A8S1QJQ2_PARPR|nr:unnamed protein product [Paramecium primaurelia]